MLQRITVPAGHAQAASAAYRYDYTIDLNADSNLAKVVQLVGENKAVLELGCATGYMARVLRERGCRVVGVDVDARAAERARQYCDRVIVGDLDTLDLAEALAGETFDVVTAADVLEHLQDPPALLTAVRPLLRPGGYVVASIPNVAHGSVRLALLGGHFPYGEKGLLDRTHLRFYTRHTLEGLFANTGYAIRQLVRHEKPLDASEVVFDKAAVPGEVYQSLSQDPDARTYQFIVAAHPIGESEVP